jgi:D-alanine-D-alanine ligase
MSKFNKVIVVGGGRGEERQVSLRSAEAVYHSCHKLGYKTIFVDPKHNPNFVADLDPTNDIVLLIIHGKDGEDGIFQAAMEKAGVRFLGSGSAASKICFYKNLTRQCYEKAGLMAADGDYIRMEDYNNSSLAKKPHILKVPDGGSSIGTLLVKDPAKVDHQAVSALFKRSEELVIEELISGTEITVSILDNEALPVIEIIPPKDQEFDYDNKYNGQTLELCPPKSISQQIQEKAKELALKAHEATGCRHLSRTDFIVDKTGQPIILETNTIPGLTDQSLYPKSAKAAGLDFTKLVERFIELTVAS